MPGRNLTTSNGYRYGFNGKENDNEIKGNGNQQDYGMRIYDPRLGKFLSVDPITRQYPELTPYQFASNTPIQAIDLDGLEKLIVIDKKNFGLRMVLWVLNSTQVWRQFQKDMKDPNINPEKRNVYIGTFKEETSDGETPVSMGIDKDGNFTNSGFQGSTHTVTEGNALNFGIWDEFKDGEKAEVILVNTDMIAFIGKNLFTNTKAAINVMKKAAFALFHEGTSHALDDMQGDKNTAKQDHQKLYGDGVVLSGDYSPSYEEIDIKGKSNASEGKRQIEKAGTTVKEKIESIKKK